MAEASTSSPLSRLQEDFLKALSSKYFGSSELEVIWGILQEHARPGDSDDVQERRLCYRSFLKAMDVCRARFGGTLGLLLNASSFLRLKRCPLDGSVSVRLLFQLAVQRATLLNRRYQLACYDEDGDGVLTPAQLRRYVRDVAEQVPQIAQFSYRLDLDQYADVALRKLLFFHGGRGGRVAITDLLGSAALGELLAMGDADLDAMAAGGGAAAGGALPWFSVHSMLSMRDAFAELDKDRDGRLSVEDFQGISHGTMSPLFLSRMFERFCKAALPPAAPSHPAAAAAPRPIRSSSASRAGPSRMGASPANSSSAGGRSGPGSPSAAAAAPAAANKPYLDFLGFVDFLVAWEHRATAQGVSVIFPALDLRQRGFICQDELYIFVKEIHTLWLAFGQSADIQVMDILAEVVDILKPRDARRIRPADFHACGMAATLLGMLGDVNLFWEWENREMLQQQQNTAVDSDGDEVEVF